MNVLENLTLHNCLLKLFWSNKIWGKGSCSSQCLYSILSSHLSVLTTQQCCRFTLDHGFNHLLLTSTVFKVQTAKDMAMTVGLKTKKLVIFFFTTDIQLIQTNGTFNRALHPAEVVLQSYVHFQCFSDYETASSFPAPINHSSNVPTGNLSVRLSPWSSFYLGTLVSSRCLLDSEARLISLSVKQKYLGITKPVGSLIELEKTPQGLTLKAWMQQSPQSLV